MNEKLFGNKIMLPSLKGPHKSIQLLVIGRVVKSDTIECFAKIGNGVPLL